MQGGNSGENISNFVPSAETVSEHCALLIEDIYAALDEAYGLLSGLLQDTLGKNWRRDREKRKIANGFAHGLMRFHLQSSLKERGQEITDEIADDDTESFPQWERNILSNNGLSGKYNGYPYKILKALNGKLPPPATSKKKRDFYRQIDLLQLFLMPPEGEGKIRRPNIVFLWDTPKPNIITLSLLIPKWATKKRVSVFDSLVLPHPATVFQGIGVDESEEADQIDVVSADEEITLFSEDDQTDS